MSNNFKIANGDLVVQSRSYDRVSGLQKLQQDLILWILEHIGTDPSTPTYGSSLDGGVIDGSPVPSFIGEQPTQARIQQIVSEVRRVLELYQQTQINKMQLEMSIFRGKHTLSADEVLASVDSINAVVEGDQVIVQVGISTASNQSLLLTIPAQA